MTTPLWPVQANGIDGTVSAIADGCRRVCLTSPTGTGKTAMCGELIRHYAGLGWSVILYTNRRALVEQTTINLTRFGIAHGIRAAGYPDRRELPVQLSSIHTELERCGPGIGEWEIHGKFGKALVICDEAHSQAGPKQLAHIQKHLDAGHVVVGVTATPIGLGGLYDRLVIAGNVADGRKCGALVEAVHYGPDEPDLKKLKGLREGENIPEAQLRKVINRPALWGRVFAHYEQLNPARDPALLFASGVEESLWFAEQFERKGVPAAHVDGDDVWLGGRMYPASPEARADVKAAAEAGYVKVVCNRFVLREGSDWPFLRHGIFATVFGALSAYLQAGGRLLRAHPGKTRCVIQDHGGNYLRHGSLNTNRVWRLDDSPYSLTASRVDELREHPEREPWRCPKCTRILNRAECPDCGFRITKRSRPVMTTDGELKLYTGPAYLPRRVAKFAGAEDRWVRIFWASRKMKKNPRTFRAAFAFYAEQSHWNWPDPAWRFMPLNEADRYRRVADVPLERLRR